MSPLIISVFFLLYTSLIFLISHFTSRKATNETYLTGNKSSPWFLVAYGMIGASLSGLLLCLYLAGLEIQDLLIL